MQGLRFEVEVRAGGPAACVPAETNDLTAAIGTSGSTGTQMAVTGLDAGPSQMKCSAKGGAPTTPPDTVVGSTNRSTHTTGDVQGWVVLLNAMGHHPRHRHKQRCEQAQQ